MAQHIGEMIRQELEKQERTVSWFARKLSCSRNNVYNIFARNNIDIVLLMRISQVLNRNFLHEYADLLDSKQFDALNFDTEVHKNA